MSIIMSRKGGFHCTRLDFFGRCFEVTFALVRFELATAF